MPQQIRQLRPLLDEVRIYKRFHLLLEVRNANQLAKHMAGVIETERLVKVARDQIPLLLLQFVMIISRFPFNLDMPVFTKESALPARKQDLFSILQKKNEASILEETCLLHLAEIDDTITAGAKED